LAKAVAKRRRRAIGWAAAGAAVVVATASLGFLAGRYVSPRQLAAEASPPPSPDVTYTLELGVLRSELIGRAAVARPEGLGLAPASRLETQVVTGTAVQEGGEAANASLVCEVSGEPVVLFQGAFAPYRDLGVGDAGPDVDMLRAAVGASGYRDGWPGPFDAALLEGVKALYRDLGYTLPTRLPEAAAEAGAGGSAPEADGGEPAPPATPEPEPFLPRQWWLTAPSLPAPVTATSIKVGNTAAGERGLGALTVSASLPVLDVTLPGAMGQADLEGSRVLFEPTGSDPVECVAGGVALTDQGTESTAALSVACGGDELAELKTGAAGRVVFVLAEAAESLVAPVTAIQKDSAGGPAVRLAGGERRLVAVELGLEVNGMVQVKGEGLEAGTVVILDRSG
jgi:hypothetical protein